MDEKLRLAFEEQALCHLDAMYSSAMRLTRSAAEAQDLVQETSVRAFCAFERFEPGTNCRAWMFRILMNTFINGYRRRRRERVLLDCTSDPTLSERIVSDAQRHAGRGSDVADGSMADEVERALEELPDEYRAVVVAVDLGEMSYKETAQALGCPLGTVMSRLHRARRMLSKRLAGYAEREGYLRPMLAVA